MKSRTQFHRLAIAGFALAMLVALPAGAETKPSPGWVADPATGCLVWSDNPQPGESITWSGPCEDGIAQGRGVLQWSGAEFDRHYEGEIHDGKITGEGSEIFASGGRYDGEFRDGLRNGHGVYIYANGDRYDGEWRDGKAEGHGVKTYASGNSYDGTFRAGHYDGQSVFTWSDGSRYVGAFLDDAPNGRGVFTWPKGDRYDGEFRRGQRSGHGVAIFSSGARYDGEWRDGKPNGAGVYVAGHERFNGTWTNGCFDEGGRRAFVAVSAAACR